MIYPKEEYIRDFIKNQTHIFFLSDMVSEWLTDRLLEEPIFKKLPISIKRFTENYDYIKYIRKNNKELYDMIMMWWNVETQKWLDILVDRLLKVVQ